MNRTVVPQAGVNALMCPACAEKNAKANAAAAKRNKVVKFDRYVGTLFVPISLALKAAIEAGRPYVVKVLCHSENHEATVKFAVSR